MQPQKIRAWHFAADNRRLGYGDNREIRVGETLWARGKPKLCENGMHASKLMIDALGYAPDMALLCEVELLGSETYPEVLHDLDKSVAAGRKVLRMADVSGLLPQFARAEALRAPRHIWKQHFKKDQYPEVWKWLLLGGNPEEHLAAWRGVVRVKVRGRLRGAAYFAWSAAVAAVRSEARSETNPAWLAANERLTSLILEKADWELE